ncbi:fimbrial protein [Pantoea osteomyelitidis]|uniref:Fimbrial protein n=1 Tax=Pantoea osteomyelitidis TaxID=3230026 RepID=A0ABW7Q0V3_9GAMM
MSGRNLILLICLFFAHHVQAICYLDPAYAGNQTMTLPPITLKIDADAAADMSVPFYKAETPRLGTKVSWINCEKGYKVGRDVYYLTGFDPQNNSYATSVPGIRVRPVFSNGVAYGYFPREQDGPCDVTEPTMKCRINVPEASLFGLEFYKSNENLKLSDKSGNIVLSAGDLLYYWIEYKTPANQTLKLYINDIKIVSTPVCNVSETINIDYGHVTSRTLTTEGIEKPLDFYINCKTDYGTYSASAHINTDTPSSDSKYIKVQDASGSINALGIKIQDSKGKELLLNRADSFEIKSNTASGSQAKFNWKAILFPVMPGVRPVSGAFKAQAQITFTIN